MRPIPSSAPAGPLRHTSSFRSSPNDCGPKETFTASGSSETLGQSGSSLKESRFRGDTAEAAGFVNSFLNSVNLMHLGGALGIGLHLAAGGYGVGLPVLAATLGGAAVGGVAGGLLGEVQNRLMGAAGEALDAKEPSRGRMLAQLAASTLSGAVVFGPIGAVAGLALPLIVSHLANR